MTRSRFRPSRAGIVGLWDYTDASFAFADGRLVLRGANGSGKTKALEVLFPFVLDGRLDPRRLDPFSGENRTMKENLLWRGGDAGYGYAWMEFAAPDGGRHVTVGVGLQAQRHRPSPKAWFFVAEGRVGDNIVLVDPDGRPRTRRALADHLGDGVVVDRASEHRRRVDDALFGLGPERYEAMLDLVLTLRRPMLAKDLDPQRLSETLTRGLRPLDDDLLEQVARSFDDLEAVQRDLERLVAADDAVQRFATDYRGYLRTQARHRADQVIDAAAARDAARARQQTAHQALDEARAAEAMAEAEVAANGDRLAAARGRRDALRSSDAFQSAAQLEHLDQAVRDLADALARSRQRASEAADAAQAAEAERDEAGREADRATAAVNRLRHPVATSAADAGVEWTDQDATGTADELRRRLGGRVAARRADLQAVRQALTALADAERRAAAADRAVDRAEAADEAAVAELAAAEQAVAGARAELRDAVGAWAQAHTEVVDATGREVVAGAVAELGRDDAPTLAQVWRDHLDAEVADAHDRRARHQAAIAEVERQAEALRERRQAIADEQDDAPPALPWRGDGRDHRAGAPLWRLIRFADHVADSDAAGIEAALEAAGLLDAWVAPDGAVAGSVEDAFLTVGSSGAAPGAGAGTDGPTHVTLAEVLVPEEQDAVPAVVVGRLLRQVALPGAADGTGADGATGAGADGATGTGADADDPGGVAVWADGRYRLGPLAGRHRVDAPRYIGATARAAHRAARIAALDEELAVLARDLAQFEAALAAVEGWLAAVRDATAALPDSRPLHARLRAQDQAAGRRQQARAALDAAREDAAAARREVGERRQALQREAQGRNLPASEEGVAAVTDALERLTADGAELVRAIELAALRAEAAAAATDRARRAVEAAATARRELADRQREHQARRSELDTLQEQMGAEAERVMAELDEVERAIRDGEAAAQRLATAVQQAAAARGQAEGEVGAAGEAVVAADRALAAAEEALAVLARPDLAGPLGLELPDATVQEEPQVDQGTPVDVDGGVTPGWLLDAVDALVTGVSAAEDRRKASQTRVTRGLEDLEHALGAGYRASWDVEDGLIAVTVADDVGVRSMAAFAEQLARQRADQEALLTDRERALFEDTLLASICGQIHGRTQATRELVATMDAEMRARRLSSGQTVGVAWRPDDTATPEWRQVHRLLDQDPAHFGPDQLELLRRHFAAEIKAARAADPQSPYRELLARVLDYRRWRRFELYLVEPDGSQSLLTRARHARLSGGEKAASLHLPLFAAAHAAFDGARPTCPRLLGLDEAFAGIDDQGRAELLSLTVAFDLDLFMTGYDLWAVDAAVPAVAHYDLLHLVDEHAVSTLLVLWNGRELVEGPDAEVALAGLAAGPALSAEAGGAPLHEGRGL